MAGYRQDQLFHIPYSCCACKNNDAAPKNFCHQKIMKPTSTVNRKNTWSHFYIKVIGFYSHFHSCTNTFIPTELHRIYIKKQSDPDSFLAPVHKKKKKQTALNTTCIDSTQCLDQLNPLKGRKTDTCFWRITSFTQKDIYVQNCTFGTTQGLSPWLWR